MNTVRPAAPLGVTRYKEPVPHAVFEPVPTTPLNVLKNGLRSVKEYTNLYGADAGAFDQLKMMPCPGFGVKVLAVKTAVSLPPPPLPEVSNGCDSDKSPYALPVVRFTAIHPLSQPEAGSWNVIDVPFEEGTSATVS